MGRIFRNAVLWPLAALFCFSSCRTEQAVANEGDAEQEIELVVEPALRYGIQEDAYLIHEGTLANNEFLADILLRYGVPYAAIAELDRVSRTVYPVTKLRMGSKYALFLTPDSQAFAHYFVVETSAADYVVYQLNESIAAYIGSKPITYRQREAYGEINSSLYQTIADQQLPVQLAVELSNIYAWTVDFYRIQRGDGFRVIFTEKFVDNEVVGVHEIVAAEFTHRGRAFTAFRFHDGEKDNYFNEEGESLRKAFLKAPLEFSRISSRFSNKRFHPVQKRWKAHLGTDYAAPGGTPILSTGDGTVVESSYSKYNGNYVKVRHNSTYSTQYLHMSKRGVKKGDVVRQGQVIGYVGATGLATGPHVCYRFWKNGQQVDPYSEEIPASDPVPAALRPAYSAHLDSLSAKLAAVATAHEIL